MSDHFGLFGTNPIRVKFLWSLFFSIFLFSTCALLAPPSDKLSTLGLCYHVVNILNFFAIWHRILDKELLPVWIIVTPIRIIIWTFFRDYRRGSLLSTFVLLWAWHHGFQYLAQLYYPRSEINSEKKSEDKGKIVYKLTRNERTSLYESQSIYERRSLYESNSLLINGRNRSLYGGTSSRASRYTKSVDRRFTQPLFLFNFGNKNENEEDTSETDEEDMEFESDTRETSDCITSQLVDMILSSIAYSRKRRLSELDDDFSFHPTAFAAGDWNMEPQKSSNELSSDYPVPKYMREYPDIFANKQ